MSKPKYTARTFGARLRRALKVRGVEADVTARTVSFSGFGYGSGVSAEVRTSQRLKNPVLRDLVDIEDEFVRNGDGPAFSESQPSAFLVVLRGPRYPFGGKPRALLRG